MKECNIPVSPNWFYSSASSGHLSGLYAFGGRQYICVYDVSNANHETLPRLVGVYSEHKELISSVCLSPDPEQLLCCSSDDKNVRMWDVRSLITIQCHNTHTEQITCMTWSPQNTDLVFTASEKGNIVLWRLKENTVSSFNLQKDCIISMKASPHSANALLIGYKKGLAVIADISKCQPQIIQRFSGNDGEITSVCWCPRLGENFLDDDNDSGGVLLATAGRRYIKVWSSVTGEQVFCKESQRAYSSDVPDYMSKKAWLDLHWPQNRPDSIIFTSQSGDLNVWNLKSKPSQKATRFSCKKLTTHNKKIFNVVMVGKDRLASFSLDRMICIWDMESLSAVCTMPTIGGNIFCIRVSPLDPGYVAIGSGTNTISIWNQGNKYDAGDMTNLNYGTRSKITCVAWHPTKEGLLAFGSQDGRVGVCNALAKRPPTLSRTFHKKTVYVVCWAHPLKNDGEDKLTVYSVGDGNILQHYISTEEHKKNALNVMDCLKDVNGDQINETLKSDLTWSHDFTKFAIGSGNGAVEIYNFPNLRIECSIQCHTKTINCIRWHPQATEETSHSSVYRNWIAMAGNDQHISILDLSALGGTLDSEQGKPTVLTQPFRLLKGHSKRITDMCWSLHKNAHLVSVSFDSSAIVWNARTAEALVCCREHSDRLYTVLWSSFDPDLIMSAGTDFLRVWRISSQPKADLSAAAEKKQKKKKLTPATAQPSGSSQTTGHDELKELRDLLDMKKRQLLMQVDDIHQTEARGGCQEIHSGVTTSGKSPRDGSGTPADGMELAGIPPDQVPSPSSPDNAKCSSSNISRSSCVNSNQPNAGLCTAINIADSSISSSLCEAKKNEEEDEEATGFGAVETDGRSKRLGISRITASTTAGMTMADRAATPACNSNYYESSHGGCREGDDYDYGIDTVAGFTGGANGGDRDDKYCDGLAVSVEDLVPPVKPLLPKHLPPTSAWSPYSSSAQPRSVSTSGGAFTSDCQGGARKRKLKIRSFFPVLSREANKGKTSLQEDLLDLTAAITGQGDNSELVDKKPHLGLYTDRLGAHRCLLQESESHLSHENMEYHLQVELWRGNVAGALQIARQRNELSDWIVAMAPLASHELWEVVCVEYAEQLEEEGHYHKAASYLLAGHRVHQAIELFRNHRLYKEAVSLARIRLSQVDPILEDLYTEWGQSLMKDGQFEQAAKCYLAMRQIQEASKIITRRNDQSSLKTACQISLLAKDEPLGMEYAFRLFSQYLIAGEWEEAYSFVKDHNSLKPFLPLLSTHELLVEQLSARCPDVSLTQKPLGPSPSFGQWGPNQGLTPQSRINLPDFLVNGLDTDPVVPWRPVLINGHTFPHHVLRQWYYRLNMDFLPQELKLASGVITHLLEFQKSFVDIPQSMVVLSTHLTLCFLSLLLSETSTAITHLLKATAFLHQNELRGNLLCYFCQLVLPQGPKYLLKLQQEFNASRLVISMESPGGGLEQAGGEGHSTIKKYLSDIKDNDRGISSAGSRCRELDCLRSFYYLAVLEYLNEEFSRVGQHGEDDGKPPNDAAPITKPDQPDHVTNIENGNTSDSLPSSPKKSVENSNNALENSLSSPVDPSDHKKCLPLMHSPDEEAVWPQSNSVHEQNKHENESKYLSSSELSPKSSSPESLSSLSMKGDKSKPSPSSCHKAKLDHKNLLHISKGILWDIQAKREALTETLGYIHHAISQHLLANRSGVSSTAHQAPKSTTPSPDINKTTSADEDGSCHSSRLLSPPSYSPLSSLSPLPANSPSSTSNSLLPSVTDSSPLSSSPPPPPQQLASTNGNKNKSIPPTSSRPTSQEVNGNISRRAPLINRSISETVSSRKVSENPNVPTDILEVRQKVEQELLGITPTSPSMALHRNRKVFWRDSKESTSGSIDVLVKRNPEGTQIPIEWDELPVDTKYTQPYISQALLKQEQEIIAAELKQGPDGFQVPFPKIHQCTKTLLDACVNSIDLSIEEKQAYMKHLKDWSVLFAVTSYDKDRVEKEFAAASQQQLQQ